MRQTKCVSSSSFFLALLFYFIFILFLSLSSTSLASSIVRRFQPINSDEIHPKGISKTFSRNAPLLFKFPIINSDKTKRRQEETFTPKRYLNHYGIYGIRSGSQLFEIPGKHHYWKGPDDKDEKCGLMLELSKHEIGVPEPNEAITHWGQIPWQVALFTHDEQFLCSGTLISSSHVVTAAICLLAIHEGHVVKPSQSHLEITLKVGAWNLEPTSVEIDHDEFPQEHKTTVSEISYYPEQDVSRADNQLVPQIAILKLKASVDFTASPYIQPICLDLPTPSPEEESGTSTSSPVVTSAFSSMPSEENDLASDTNNEISDESELMVKKNAKQELEGGKTDFVGKLMMLKKKKLSNKAQTASMGKRMPKKITKAMDEDLECYVSGWDLQNDEDLADRHMKKRLSKREVIDSYPSIVIPFDTSYTSYKYVVNRPDETSEATEASSQSLKSMEVDDDENEISSQSSESTEIPETSPTDEQTLEEVHSNQPYPQLDPVEDYADSFERRKGADSTAMRNRSSKKQLKSVFDEKQPEPPASRKSNYSQRFRPIESDEIPVDKEDVGHEYGTLSPWSELITLSRENEERHLKLQWAYVNLKPINISEERMKDVDLALGTAYIEPTSLTVSRSLCMVDIGSPVVCNVRESLDAYYGGLERNPKFLAGIVTWKLPCRPQNAGALVNNLVQVTPTDEFIDYVVEHVKDKKTNTPEDAPKIDLISERKKITTTLNSMD